MGKAQTLALTLGLLSAGMCAWGQVVPAPPAPQSVVPQGLDTPAAQAASKSTGKAGEAPLDTPAAQASRDASAVGSPVPAAPRRATIRVGTNVRVTVTRAVSSGAQKNGDKVQGKLAAAVRTAAGMLLPAGTAVTGTVVSAAKAGAIASGGVLSLQLTSVGGVHLITDVRSFNGAEGHKDLPDSAPEKGSEAVVAVGTVLNFHVMEQGKATGLVPGVAPARGAGVQANKTSGNGKQTPVGRPDTSPGVSQAPAGGATQGVVPQGSTPK